VFPCFGPPSRPDHSKLAQHGFARSEIWSFDSVVMDNDAGVSVRLSELLLELLRARELTISQLSDLPQGSRRSSIIPSS